MAAWLALMVYAILCIVQAVIFWYMFFAVGKKALYIVSLDAMLVVTLVVTIFVWLQLPLVSEFQLLLNILIGVVTTVYVVLCLFLAAALVGISFKKVTIES